MHNLIFEQKFSGGHNLAYVARITEAYLAHGHTVTFARPDAATEAAPYKTHIAPLRGDLREVSIPMRTYASQRWLAPWRDWHLVKALSDSIRPSRFIFSTSDGMVESLAVSSMALGRPFGGETRAEGLVMAVPQAYSDFPVRWTRSRWLTAALYARSPIDRFRAIDPIALGFLKRHVTNKVSSFVPDPFLSLDTANIESPTRDAIRATHGIHDDRFYIASIGEQSGRKGLELLLAGVGEASRHNRVGLIIAGRQNEHVKTLLSRFGESHPTVPVLTENQYVSNRQFVSYIQLADAVSCLYENHYQPSGIAVSAALLGTPILGSNHGWIPRFVKATGLGTVSVMTPSGVAKAIQALIANTQCAPPAFLTAMHSQSILQHCLTTDETTAPAPCLEFCRLMLD
jgi:glycosyltransferase involved in cell wall biosynthesis